MKQSFGTLNLFEIKFKLFAIYLLASSSTQMLSGQSIDSFQSNQFAPISESQIQRLRYLEDSSRGACIILDTIDPCRYKKFYITYPIWDFDDDYLEAELKAKNTHTVEAYPDPFWNYIHFKSNEAVLVQLINMNGQTVFKETIEGEWTFETADLQAGIYVLLDQNGQVLHKLVHIN